MQEEKVIRFEINPQNKQLLELQLESKDNDNICWEDSRIELIIDLNHMAFHTIEHLSGRLFSWLKLFTVKLTVIINNIPEDRASSVANINLFNSIINKIESCKSIKYLKFIVVQTHVFNDCDISGLTRMPNLKVIDLSGFNIQLDEWNNYIPNITDFLNNIEEISNINKILLPANFKKQILNVESGVENEFFLAIRRALLDAPNLIEISPLPMFVGLQEDIQAIMNKKQGADLEGLYYEHDRDLETLTQLKKIHRPSHDIAILLANTTNRFNNIFKDLDRFIPIISSMKPKNIYWLDKILREKLNNPNHILTCLATVKSYENAHEILFKMLHALVSDLMACRIKESDVYEQKLTEFIFTDDFVSKESILRTLFKIHLEFDLSRDECLSKIFANILEEFVNYSSGIRLSNDNNRVIRPDKLEYINLLMILANTSLFLYQEKQTIDIINQEAKLRSNMEITQLEDSRDLFFKFNRELHTMLDKKDWYIYGVDNISINNLQSPRPS